MGQPPRAANPKVTPNAVSDTMSCAAIADAMRQTASIAAHRRRNAARLPSGLLMVVAICIVFAKRFQRALP